MIDMPGNDRDTATGDAQAATEESSGAPVVLPHLWSASLGRCPESVQVWPVAGGQILMGLAEFTVRSPDEIRAAHVMREGHSAADLSRLRVTAMVTMAAGLRVEEALVNDDVDVLMLRRDDGLPVSGAVLLTSLPDRVSALRDWPELIVAILDPHTVWIVSAGSPGANMLSWTVAQREQAVADSLRPCLLRVGAGGVELLQEGGSGHDRPGGATQDAPPNAGAQGKQGQVLLPLVRSASIRQGRDLWDMPWWDIADDRIYATLARMSVTPHGTIGLAHVMRGQLADDDHVAALKQEAITNASWGIGVEAMGDGERVLLLRVVREDRFPVAGILLRPDFFQWVNSYEPWPELIVGIPHGEEMYIAPAGSDEAEVLRQQMIPTVEQCDPDLRPSLLRVTAEGMEFLLEGGGSFEEGE
jgi:hypothetical protein